MEEFNAITFLTQGGPVSMSVALALLAMSVASWSLLITKLWQDLKTARNGAAFVFHFHTHRSLEAAEHAVQEDSEYKQLTRLGMAAATHHQSLTVEGCSRDEFTARALQRGLQEVQGRMESGLTVLASVGSVAPFVGLFGTVWGIYHALASISASGQATLDKVAGPVGESLIMTAFGLAVAIPAVLAYNALVRRNRKAMARIEAFAYHLHVYLVTGRMLPAAKAEFSATTELKAATA
ncbi:biopolymer transport protein ExbB [Novimethylophilus kurashikiensis]|uniref:Biopolymer transport protein ExbB n=1 Tax=Novimethylophilus kurashikiensis TaxID=1825523 RepID=A0A2R5F732_9PROT|nr:MotA/TolQ/ExbB proton channel family protein [Novimethylophilus kurashikiensis]GBG12491.1 biopolymer transport protein ExbB [Novimethylophilus kurashikiensis]